MTSPAARFGIVDRLALRLFTQVADLAQNEEWDDLFEDAVFQQSDFDPGDDVTDEQLDEFYDEVEKFRDTVLCRVGRALVAHKMKTGDKLVLEYYRQQSQLPQQT